MTDTDLRPAVAFPAALEAFLDSPHRTRRDTVWHRCATDFYEQPMRALAEAADNIGSAREYAYACHDANDKGAALAELDEVRAHLQSQLNSARKAS